MLHNIWHNWFMPNNSLKELLRIYSHLPAGLIVFKSGQLYFVNNHLRDVLVLGELPVARSLEILCGTLELPVSADALRGFLKERRFFLHKAKYLQVSHRSPEPYDIYLITRIDPALLEHLGTAREEPEGLPIEGEPVPEAAADTQMHTELLKYFDTLRGIEVTGYALFKGVPLISRNTVLQPFKGTLALKAEDKQMIAAQEGVPWILKVDSGVTVQGSVIYSDSERRYLFLNNLRRVDEGFHQREQIRYRIDSPVSLLLDCDGQQAPLRLIELSESSFMAVTDSSTLLQCVIGHSGEMPATLTPDKVPLTLQCRFIREAGRSEGEAALVFTFRCGETAMGNLRNWLYARQLAVIKEIRAFTGTLP
jgi:hypothetical protein